MVNITSRPEGLRKLATTTNDVADVSASVVDNLSGLNSGELIIRGIKAGSGIKVNVIDADGYGGTQSKAIEIATTADSAGGEANTISSVGGGLALTATSPKVGSDLRVRSLSAGPNIDINVSGDLITISSSLSTGPEGSPGLIWRGVWNGTVSYLVKDVVFHNGSSYVATSNNTNTAPPSAYWSLVAQKGDTGATGPTGLTGDTGPQGVQGPIGPKGDQGLVWRNAWDGATTYNVGDAVSYSGSSYVAITNHVGSTPPSANWGLIAQKGDTGAAGPTGLTGPQGPAGSVWRGTWDSATSYVSNDVVFYNGSSYISVANNTNSMPPSANWNLVAQKGDTGPQGIQGLKGDTGDTGPQGIQGLKGDTGDTGPQGIQGPKGDTGDTGAAGLITVSELGTGEGHVYSGYSAGTLSLRTITKTGPGTVSQDADHIYINFPTSVTNINSTTTAITVVDGTTTDLTFVPGNVALVDFSGDLPWTRVSGKPTIPSNLVDLSDVNFTGTPSNGDVLKWNTDHWEFGPDQVGAPGTGIAAIGLNVPSFLTSDHTSANRLSVDGDISVTLATQAANKIFAGPSTGVDAVPTFRSLEIADLPSNIPDTKLATIGVTKLAAGTNGQYLKTNAGVVEWANLPADPTYTLDDLTDVTITSASNGQVLSYNGTGWVNTAAPASSDTAANRGDGTNGEAVYDTKTGGTFYFKRVKAASSKLTLATDTNSVTFDVAEGNLNISNMTGSLGNSRLIDLDASKLTGTIDAARLPLIDLTNKVTGILPVANGGTGASTLTANRVLIGNGTSAVSTLSAPTDGTFLKYTTANGYEWVANSGSGVTSVGLSAPSDFVVSNSPVTTSGTLTIAYAVQAANKVFAGPATGADATPTYRSLVVNDLPTIGDSKISDISASKITGTLGVLHGGTGLTSVANQDILVGNSGGGLTALNVGANGKVLGVSSGVVAWVDPPASGSANVNVRKDGAGGFDTAVINFTGTGVTVTNNGGNADVSIPTTTASNIGSGAGIVGIYKQKASGNIELKSLNALSNKVSLTDNTTNNVVDIDVVESNITLSNLSGTLQVAKGGTGLTTLTANALLVGDGTNAVKFTPAASSGFLRYNGSAFVWTTDLLVNDPNPTLSAPLNTNGQTITSPNNTDIVITPAGTGNTVIGGITYKKRTSVTLTGGATATTFYTYNASTYEAVFIEYVLRRGSIARIGTLMVTNNGTVSVMGDYGSESADTGVVFSASYNAGNIEIKHTSTAGADSTLTYALRAWDL